MSRLFGTLVRCIALALLIAVLAVGGLIWFDYLGVINIKPQLSWLYKLLGWQTTSIPAVNGPFVSDLDDDRLAKRLEALSVRSEELDKREAEVTQKEGAASATLAELEALKSAQEERESAFNALVQRYDDRIVNLETLVANLNGMAPQNAVAILLEMSDQDVIDILRKNDEIAAANASASLGPFWISLMPPDRAAAIQRKMLEKPAG